MSALLHCYPFGQRSYGGRPAKMYDWKYDPQHRVYGRGIVFELPEDLACDPARLLKKLGEQPGKNPGDAEKRLAALIEENSRKMVLPPAALVAREVVKGDSASSSLIDIVTVLAKSSGKLYLQNKSPNVKSIGQVRRVVLVIPPTRDESGAQSEERKKGAA